MSNFETSFLNWQLRQLAKSQYETSQKIEKEPEQTTVLTNEVVVEPIYDWDADNNSGLV